MRLVMFAVSFLALAACAGPPGADVVAQTPKAAATASAKPPTGPWRLQGRAMAAAADPRAVNAAIEVMKQGGSAVDAALAAHAVLGLVEPQSSGLGGGGFMVVFDRKSGTVTTFDGREMAPATATQDYFTVNGKNLDFLTAIQSGKSMGVPGTVALYKAAHEKFGKLPWGKDFEAAIKLADEGFIVSPRLSQSLSARFQNGQLGKDPQAGPYFFPNGKALAVGDRRDNKPYADVLRLISKDGPSAFYSGPIAQSIVDADRAGDIPGELTLKDLADYKVRVVPAICGPYHDYRICSAPPASSGGVAMNEIVSIYHTLVHKNDDKTEAEKLRDFVIANQLGYADRDHYVADPEAVSVPVKQLLDPKYLAVRAATPFKPGDDPKPGDPGAVIDGKPMIDMWGRDMGNPMPGTSHMSFVDFDGNAVSFTDTVESPFGSSRWTHGFILNNQLTDFTRPPTVNGKLVANAPGPHKRPRSSMSPTIVLDKNGDVFMVTGSPGGNSIVGYVAKTLVAVLDWGKTAQEAAALPNVVARGQTVRVETSDAKAGPNAIGKAWLKILTDQGFKTQEVSGEVSGINIVVARQDHLEGGTDPRREGAAIEAVK
ncbi:MAG TPA: gamma-glutamyltransferase family protein [Hyphomonadaceae bacterium]|nr:gamma-glutamyltransferase family protein [Hyphomonadaceae bacterium]